VPGILDLPYLDAIKRFEGYNPRAQWDYAQYTSGYGTRAKHPGEVIDRATAEQRFGDEIGNAAGLVDQRFPGLPEGPRAALTSLTFNAGPGWADKGLGRAVSAGDWDTARNLFSQYVKAGGKTLPGLVDRRNQEASWFTGPLSYAATGSPAGLPEQAGDDPTAIPPNAQPTAGRTMAGILGNGPPSGGGGLLGGAFPANAWLGYLAGALQGGNLGQSIGRGLEGYVGGQQADIKNQGLAALQQYAANAPDIEPALRPLLAANPQLAQSYIQKRMDPLLGVPAGFSRTQGGGLVPIPGGPADPKYIASTVGAKDKTTEQIAEREAAVRGRGLDPNDPQFRSYILTGKMPREDQQPLTATDKKAILEADEGVMAAEAALTALNQAKTLSKDAFSGPLASQRGYVAGLTGPGAGQTTTDLDNLIQSNALSQLKSIFGAAPTEGERKILLEIQGSTSQPDAVRQKIYDRAIVMANRRLELNRQRANELRGGTFYKPQEGRPQPAASGTPAPAPSTPTPSGVVNWERGPDGRLRRVQQQ
jgi:GH24 family phage-related lysozyme (muramidase)